MVKQALFVFVFVLGLGFAGLLPALAQPGLLQPIALQEIDAGPAVPVSPYVSYLIAGADQQGVLDGLAFPLVSALPSARLMKAGTQVLDARWVTTPLFLIASDTRSLRWLEQNAAQLARMGAAGLVLDARDAQAFKLMQEAAERHALPLAPGPDHWLEQLLLARGSGVLPLLIGFDGRAVQDVQEAPAS